MKFVNATLVDPVKNIVSRGSISVENGRIVAESLSTPVDGSALVIMPGLIDVHVHFRDPGGLGAETLESGAAAAARGGFSIVTTMPNTTPPCDSPELLRRQIAARLPIEILPAACATKGRCGREVADLETLAKAGAAAFSDDGNMIADDGVMLEVMTRAAKLALPVMDHAMLPSLMADGVIRECGLARRLRLPTISPETEIAAVQRDIELARQTGARVHIQHISCKGSVDAVRIARERGICVTAEATPHHLLFSCDDIPGDDGNWRMNPPLGTPEDRAALRQAVIDGVISVLATDHAPHTTDSKSKGFLAAPFGVIGLETALFASYQALVVEEKMPLLDFVKRWTAGPAALMNVKRPPLGAVGSRADFIAVDFSRRNLVDAERFASHARNCPFNGMSLPGEIVWREF